MPTTYLIFWREEVVLFFLLHMWVVNEAGAWDSGTDAEFIGVKSQCKV